MGNEMISTLWMSNINIGEVLLMFLASMAVLYILQLTGKVNLGLYIPGVNVPLRKSYRKYLYQHIRFYRHLDQSQKRQFEKKIRKFIVTKRFVPRQIPSVTPEMKVCLAAKAVQISFGLKNLVLKYFTHLLVYPDDYYSTINKKYHKGEVNPKMRAIVVSWKGFLDGVKDAEDGRNLGLHEMAHAYYLEHQLMGSYYRCFDPVLWENWQNIATSEIENIQISGNHFFRKYAATDQHEFFAVAVENFFERPKAFKLHLPHIYNGLKALLNLDPCEIFGGRNDEKYDELE